MANRILKTLLANILQGMENGTFTCNEQEESRAIEILSLLMEDKTPMSKASVCDILGISSATFDRRVADGKIPQGRKIKGFKELVWYRSDLAKMQQPK